MLVKFELENFRSINKKAVFHTIQRNYRRFTHHIYSFDDDLKILKTNAIYGGNGSGKTNLFKGLHFLKCMATDSDYLTSSKARKIFTPFRLNKEVRKEDSKFEIDFIVSKKIFNYKLSVNHEINRITFEQLSKIEENEETIIFSRLRSSDEKTSLVVEGLEEFLTTAIKEILPGHSTLLSLDILASKPDLKKAHLWFRNKLKFLFPVYEFGDIAYILSRKQEYLELANKIAKFANLGVHRIKIDEIPINLYLGAEKSSQISQIKSILEDKIFHPFYDSKGNACTAVRKDDDSIVVMKLVTLHLDKEGNEVEFDLEQESRGTIVLIHLLPALILSYGEGVNYIIDEIGASLHPMLLREILAQFLMHNVENADGQLIFNTHEDFIMDERILRQDEIWLMDKNDLGETIIFPLSDIKNVRHDLNLRKNYLAGKFGGTQFEDNPGKLIFDVDH